MTVSVADGPLLLVMYCPAGSGINLNLSQPILGPRPARSPCIHMLLRRIFHPVKKDASPSFSFLPPSGETHPMKEGRGLSSLCIVFARPPTKRGSSSLPLFKAEGGRGKGRGAGVERREGVENVDPQ